VVTGTTPNQESGTADKKPPVGARFHAYRAGHGAGDAINGLDLANGKLSEGVHVRSCNTSQHVVGARNNHGTSDGGDLLYLSHNPRRFSNLGLDQHIGFDHYDS
jgi:hypothetical protein